MKLPVDVDGREHLVEMALQRERGRHEVTVGEWAASVEAVAVGPDRWSLIVCDQATGRPLSVDAVVRPHNGDGTFDVYIGGHRMVVGLRNGRVRRARGDATGHGAGPQRIVAPMPGKVVRVLVQPGDTVQPRQGLVVVEAMKMENELRAARPGRVRDVLVRQGQSVEAGTALIVVE